MFHHNIRSTNFPFVWLLQRKSKEENDNNEMSNKSQSLSENMLIIMMMMMLTGLSGNTVGLFCFGAGYSNGCELKIS
jgi:hypothetical protein